MDTFMLIQQPSLGLYIHIPWCVKKCPYCDFNSHQQQGELPQGGYVTALLKDLEQELELLDNPSLSSIFIGGGTPSIFSAAAIKTLLDGVRDRNPFDDDIEITLEANPGTVEQEKFSGFRAAGINRLSIGIQSFNDIHLAKLGRIHDAAQAAAALGAAKAAGFDNFNIDLMHGLSGQTPTEATEDLRRAIDLNPTHLSWYQLTIEPNTIFYNTQPSLPNDDSLEQIEHAGFELLHNAGFNRYEISAFAKAGKQSKHNTNYWQFGDYIGIGAGAHGKITNTINGEINRRWKTRQPNDYLSKPPLAGSRLITNRELPLEFMMNALRLTDGVNEQLFKEKTGLSLEIIAPMRNRLIAKGLMIDGPRIATTALGFRFLDTVLNEFQTVEVI
ncbi:MAG: putative oxygen-independent coproporphyrinogen III oxidase [Pseudomonadales bacterium]|jgi:putative oxygen-independent coproporphyrinogen III oxidase